MVKQLFKRFLSTASVIAGCVLVAHSQPTTTITTNFNNSPLHTYVTGPGAPTPPQFITFNVTNSNSCPITITELHWYHVGENTYGTSLHSMNGAIYTLWKQQPAVGGGPNISAANGWIPEAVSNPISNGTVPGSIIPILTGLNISVPPATTIRLALMSTDTISFFSNVAPTAFTASGVTVNTGGGISYWGAMPGPGANSVVGSIPAFCGSIKFIDAGSAAPAAPKLNVSSLKVCRGADGIFSISLPSYLNGIGVITVRHPNGSVIYTGTNTTITIANMQPGDAGTYTVTVKDPNCGNTESLPSTLKITIGDPPAPKFEGKTDFCLNEPFTPVTVAGGGSARWYYTSTGGSPIPFTPPFNTTTVSQETFYLAQIVDGCESKDNRTPVTYRASAKPNPPLVTTPLYFCENDLAQPLTATGNQLKWYYDPIGGIPSLIAPTPNTTAKNEYNYYVSQSNRGCESNRSLIKVVVTFKPNGLIVSTKDKLCQKDTLTLSYYGSAYDSSGFNWTFPTGTQILSVDPNFSRSIKIALDSAGLRDIKLQVGHDGCYSELLNKTIRVDTLPTAEMGLRENICLGQIELVSLYSYTLSADSFFWDWDGGRVSFGATDQGPNGVIWDNSGKKYVKLRLVNKLCSNVVTDSTYVHAKPDASFKIDGFDASKVYCNSDSMRVTANTINSGSEYSWSPTRFFDEYSDQSSTYARVDFTSHLRLDVKDQYGCTNSDSIKVITKACCNVNLPSAFSPNGDGRNDLFRIIPNAPGVQRQIDVRTIKVVNRYGQVVFETVNELRGWDGTFNGKPADMGTYFYYVAYKCDGKMMENKGEVVLVR
ncbi:MAG TPA: gliding motility-associated C-terminal domain-containing protein [Flavipsychrobacter sp.]|nr:gliding motility-associated C-terminal domain-containing protein [Flavipsychrobacter sp.]